MVDGEICAGDEYAYYLGSFGTVRLGEYALYDECVIEDREEFKERYYDRNDDVLCEEFHYRPLINEYSLRNGEYTRAEFEENEQNEKRLNEHLSGLAERAFKKAIIVYIGMPDDIEEFKEDQEEAKE